MSHVCVPLKKNLKWLDLAVLLHPLRFLMFIADQLLDGKLPLVL